MKTMLPNSRPRATRDLVMGYVRAAWNAEHPGSAPPAVLLVGVRGYYRDTMGVVGENDRGIYDDALFVIGPETFAAFSGNTDPSVYRRRTGSKQGIATLKPGIHWYRPGMHKAGKPGGHAAFRPATPGEKLPVYRDGETNPAPGIAINIHRGGHGTTSSEGCQTVPPGQWPAFHALLTAELKRAGQSKFPYVLINGPIL